jgi:adenylate kinase family enzyme
MRLIFVTGQSGSGKTTYAERLSQELGCGLLTLGDVLRRIVGRSFFKPHRTNPTDERTEVLVRSLVDEAAMLCIVNDLSLVVDGYPRSVPQVSLLSELRQCIRDSADYGRLSVESKLEVHFVSPPDEVLASRRAIRSLQGVPTTDDKREVFSKIENVCVSVLGREHVTHQL